MGRDKDPIVIRLLRLAAPRPQSPDGNFGISARTGARLLNQKVFFEKKTEKRKKKIRIHESRARYPDKGNLPIGAGAPETARRGVVVAVVKFRARHCDGDDVFRQWPRAATTTRNRQKLTIAYTRAHTHTRTHAHNAAAQIFRCRLDTEAPRRLLFTIEKRFARVAGRKKETVVGGGGGGRARGGAGAEEKENGAAYININYERYSADCRGQKATRTRASAVALLGFPCRERVLRRIRLARGPFIRRTYKNKRALFE